MRVAGRCGAIVASAALLAGCSSSDVVGESDDYAVEVLVDGLVGPTQLFVDGQGWLIAQLNGGENEGEGQVLAIDPDNLGASTVIVDGLDKPTGVARANGVVWVMEAERLRRDGEIVAEQLPNNGRSQGALTLLDDRVLFNTSGRIAGGTVDPESGRVWAVEVGENGAPAGEIEPFAEGFKHGYDRVELADGTLLVTEISDGRLDGEPAADALMVLLPGQDHGWPHCVPAVGTTQRRTVVEFERLAGDADDCDALPRIITTFEVGATPTSVETVPWDPSVVAVALWGTGQVVLVSVESGETVASIDFDRPQDLVADGDRLLVVDHERGHISSVRP